MDDFLQLHNYGRSQNRRKMPTAHLWSPTKLEQESQCRKRTLLSIQINLYDRGEIQNFKEFIGGNTIFDVILPINPRRAENDFIIDKMTPTPSKLRIEQFYNEEDKEYSMIK